MPKLNKLERARPFNEILPEMLMSLWKTEPSGDGGGDGEQAVQMDVSPAVRKIYDYTKVRVNDDVCMTEAQKDVCVEDLRLLGDSGAENNIEALQGFVTFINSKRFDCCNCLNSSCKNRDPDFSVEEVKKRVK